MVKQNIGKGIRYNLIDNTFGKPEEIRNQQENTEIPKTNGKPNGSQKKGVTNTFTMLSSGIMVRGKTVTIKCCDCGAERIIKPQDAFQVKRCVDCQKKYRRKKQAENRKKKKLKEEKKEDI